MHTFLPYTGYFPPLFETISKEKKKQFEAKKKALKWKIHILKPWVILRWGLKWAILHAIFQNFFLTYFELLDALLVKNKKFRYRSTWPDTFLEAKWHLKNFADDPISPPPSKFDQIWNFRIYKAFFIIFIGDSIGVPMVLKHESVGKVPILLDQNYLKTLIEKLKICQENEVWPWYLKWSLRIWSIFCQKSAKFQIGGGNYL